MAEGKLIEGCERFANDQLVKMTVTVAAIDGDWLIEV
jgi:hypothetical protein